MIIQSDNKAIGKSFLRLEKLLVDNGAWFDSNLSIVCKGKAVSIRMMGPSKQGDVIMKVPQKLLVPALPLNFSIKENKFVIDPDKDKLSPIQIKIAKLMVNVYNATDKIGFYKKECPWVTFRKAPDLMDSLLHARTTNENTKSKQDFLHNLTGSMSLAEFVCKDFVMTRVLGHKDKKDGELIQKIMPVVDYLDHDYRASGFVFPDKSPGKSKKPNFLRIHNSQPFPSRPECYVAYGTYDALDTFLSYGFINEEVPFLRSIPLKIPVRDLPGKLLVNSYPAVRNEKKLHKQLDDLRRFMPMVNKSADCDGLVLSHLIIGLTTTPNALRRVLRVLIRTLAGESVLPKFVIDRTHETERYVIEKNIAFYESFLKEVEADQKTPAALKNQMYHIASIQLNKLYKYIYNDAYFLSVIEENPQSATDEKETPSTDEEAA